MSKYPYKGFSHTECNYYPCHKVGKLNCLFCFCPLYNMEICPGEYTILENGIKDCSNCTWVHDIDNYDLIMRILSN